MEWLVPMRKVIFATWLQGIQKSTWFQQHPKKCPKKNTNLVLILTRSLAVLRVQVGDLDDGLSEAPGNLWVKVLAQVQICGHHHGDVPLGIGGHRAINSFSERKAQIKQTNGKVLSVNNFQPQAVVFFDCSEKIIFSLQKWKEKLQTFRSQIPIGISWGDTSRRQISWNHTLHAMAHGGWKAPCFRSAESGWGMLGHLGCC